ncbi:MAG: carbon storage regulator [Agathobacter sp.]
MNRYMEVEMLKLSLKEGQYVNIGDDIRVVYVGGNGKHGRLLIDAPRHMNISRSNNDPDPNRRKETYYPEPEISETAQKEIQRIIWNERQKMADKS